MIESKIGKKVRMFKKDWKKPRKGQVVDEVAIKHFHDDYSCRLQRIEFSEETDRNKKFELRLCYYKANIFGQYAAVLPENELLILLRKAKKQGFLSKNFHIE